MKTIESILILNLSLL